jgi:hypothetical protein
VRLGAAEDEDRVGEVEVFGDLPVPMKWNSTSAKRSGACAMARRSASSGA